MDPTAARKRYIKYARVSTDEQALSGAGIASQRQQLDRAFDYEGWHCADELVDEGHSAATLERPALRQALQLIAAGDADGIVVAKLDRLTRSIVDFGELLEWLTEANAGLVALDLRLDTSTPTGAMVAQVLVVVAEWERRTIAERTRNAMAAKRAAGEATGRASLADDPELVATIRAWRDDEGLSLHAIARRLTELEIPTVRGGATWRASAVQRALGYERPAVRRKRSQLPELQRRRRA
jgi:DNA invertase Pin-like site-specific DNA recombinase